MTIDTGFGDVLAGEVYVHPDPEITVAVNPEEPPCHSPSATATTPSASTPAAPPPAPAAISALAPPPPSTTPVPSPTIASAPNAGLTPAGVQAAKALVQLPASLDWPTMAQLARAIAMDIKERHAILQEFKLTQVQYDFLEANNEFYRSALAAACKDWHAPLSTAERIKVEAAAILEDSLLGLGARMQNKGEGLPGVIEAAKLFSKIAGVGEREGSTLPAGERFTINIDLGADTHISVGVEAAPQTHSIDLRAGEVPALTKAP